MTRSTTLLCAASLGALVWAYAPEAAACRCGPIDIDMAIKASEAIALVNIAKVPTDEEVRLARTNIAYQAKIEKMFKGKGEVGKTQPLVTAASSAACGRKYEAGKKYILFVGARDGNWYDNSCSASAMLDDKGAHAHLAAIEKWIADGKELKVPEASPQGPAHGAVDPAGKDPAPEGAEAAAGDTGEKPAAASDTPAAAGGAQDPSGGDEPAKTPALDAEKTPAPAEPSSSCAALPAGTLLPLLATGLLARRRRRRS